AVAVFRSCDLRQLHSRFGRIVNDNGGPDIRMEVGGLSLFAYELLNRVQNCGLALVRNAIESEEAPAFDDLHIARLPCLAQVKFQGLGDRAGCLSSNSLWKTENYSEAGAGLLLVRPNFLDLTPYGICAEFEGYTGSVRTRHGQHQSRRVTKIFQKVDRTG